MKKTLFLVIAIAAMVLTSCQDFMSELDQDLIVDDLKGYELLKGAYLEVVLKSDYENRTDIGFRKRLNFNEGFEIYHSEETETLFIPNLVIGNDEYVVERAWGFYAKATNSDLKIEVTPRPGTNVFGNFTTSANVRGTAIPLTK